MSTTCKSTCSLQRTARAALRLKASSFTPRSFSKALPVRHERCRAKNNKNNLIKAFRYDPHNPNEGAIQDWRVKQMVELAHTYFMEFLTNKKVELADSLFAEDVLHRDVIWDPTHPTVGIEGMRHYLSDLATAFPDFFVEIDQFSTVDTNSLIVTYHGSATNLGEYHHHKATRHASSFEGTNTFKFNHDRSRITEIHVYRSAFAEDINEIGERMVEIEGGFRELRLKRLA